MDITTYLTMALILDIAVGTAIGWAAGRMGRFEGWAFVLAPAGVFGLLSVFAAGYVVLHGGTVAAGLACAVLYGVTNVALSAVAAVPCLAVMFARASCVGGARVTHPTD